MRIAILAGESSGDALGAGLIRALREHYPQAVFEGVGGPRMQAEGFHSLEDMERLSVMGFIEPLGRLPELFGIKRRLVRRWQQQRPDVFIGIDSPGFNLRLETDLHRSGIRTVHYVSPSVWAWGKGRIHTMARCVNLVLALLPFETAIYEEHGIPVRFVGHPLADRIHPPSDPAADRRQALFALGLEQDSEVLALMPGSRRDEIDRLAPVFLRAALGCLQQRPALQFLIPCANGARRQQMEQIIESTLPADNNIRARFRLYDGRSHEIIRASQLVLLASGTATLEAMLLQRPMIVCYRLAPLTWALAKRLVTLQWVSLPNLLAREELVPEYLQDAVQAETLERRILEVLDDPDGQQRMMDRFAELHLQLQKDADVQAAAAVSDLIAGRIGG